MVKKLAGNVYGTPTGVKVGTRGKVQDAKEVLYGMPKSLRRQVRKAARRLGYFHVARA